MYEPSNLKYHWAIFRHVSAGWLYQDVEKRFLGWSRESRLACANLWLHKTIQENTLFLDANCC